MVAVLSGKGHLIFQEDAFTELVRMARYSLDLRRPLPRRS